MTKEELKKKMVEIISNAWREVVPCTAERKFETIADALIEAGIGDLETTQKIGAHATAMAVLQAAEAEHRAEVAERALKLACKTIAPSYVDTAKLYFEIFVNQAEKELAEERKDEQD